MIEERLGLRGSRAVITGGGGAKGIGRDIAKDLGLLGCQICILDIDYVQGQKTAKDLNERPGPAHYIKCDITDPSSVRHGFNDAAKLLGGIDILINNAGISSREIKLQEVTADFWAKVMEVNLKGTYLCSRQAMDYLKNSPSASIVMISSGSAMTGSGGSIAYAVSKGAINGLIRGLARKLAPYGIRVNGVAPRSIDSELLKTIYKGKDISRLIEKIPLGRLGTFKNITDTVIFLASRLSGFMTGELLLLDGGRTFCS